MASSPSWKLAFLFSWCLTLYQCDSEDPRSFLTTCLKGSQSHPVKLGGKGLRVSLGREFILCDGLGSGVVGGVRAIWVLIAGLRLSLCIWTKCLILQSLCFLIGKRICEVGIIMPRCTGCPWESTGLKGVQHVAQAWPVISNLVTMSFPSASQKSGLHRTEILKGRWAYYNLL